MADAAWFNAVESGDLEALQAFAAEHFRQKDSNGRTALMIAARLGHEHIVKYLLEHEKGEADKDGYTALIHSFESDNPEICILLMQYEHSIPDFEGRIPLSIAASEGAFNSVTSLLQYYDGTEDEMGYTPLDYCSLSGHAHVLEVLLKSGLFGQEKIVKTLQHLTETSSFSLDCITLLEQELRRHLDPDAQQDYQQPQNDALVHFPLPHCNSKRESDNKEHDSLLIDTFSNPHSLDASISLHDEVQQEPTAPTDQLTDTTAGNQMEHLTDNEDAPNHSVDRAETAEHEQQQELEQEPELKPEEDDLVLQDYPGLEHRSKDSGLNFALPESSGTGDAIDETYHAQEDMPNNCSSYSAYGVTVGISSRYTEEDLAERDFGDALSRSSNDISSHYTHRNDGNGDEETTGPLDFQTPKRCNDTVVQVLDSKVELGGASVAMSLNDRVLDSIMRDDFKLSESEFFLRSLNISGGADIVSGATQTLKDYDESIKKLNAELQEEDIDVNRQLMLKSAVIDNLSSQLGIFRDMTERLASIIRKTSADLAGFQSELQSRDNIVEKLREQIMELRSTTNRVSESGRDDHMTFTLHIGDREDSVPDTKGQDVAAAVATAVAAAAAAAEAAAAEKKKEYQLELDTLKQKLVMSELQLSSVENLLHQKTEEVVRLQERMESETPYGTHHPPQFDPLLLLEEKVLRFTQVNSALEEEISKYKEALNQKNHEDSNISVDTAAKTQRILELEGQVSSLQNICTAYDELNTNMESKAMEIACLHETLDKLKAELDEKDISIHELKDQLLGYQRAAQITESREKADVIERQREEIARLDSLLIGKNEELRVLTLRIADLEFKLTESELMKTTTREADIDGPSKEDEANDASSVAAALQNIELTTILRQTEASYNKLKQEHKALQQQFSDFQMTEKMATCPKCKFLQVRNSSLTEENEAHRAEITQLKYEIRACVEQITAAHATATSYKSKLGSKEREILDCQKEIDRLLRINSKLNERLLQTSRTQTSPSTRHSYSSLSSYPGYGHATSLSNPPVGSRTFLNNYTQKSAYMPVSSSSPRKSSSPQIRDTLPSMVTAQYAVQLGDTKSYQPSLGLLPKREYDRSGPGIVPTSYTDLTIPRHSERPSPPPVHPTANPNLHNAHKRIMNASLLDALAMSGYTTENLRNAGY